MRYKSYIKNEIATLDHINQAYSFTFDHINHTQDSTFYDTQDDYKQN